MLFRHMLHALNGWLPRLLRYERQCASDGCWTNQSTPFACTWFRAPSLRGSLHTIKSSHSSNIRNCGAFHFWIPTSWNEKPSSPAPLRLQAETSSAQVLYRPIPPLSAILASPFHSQNNGRRLVNFNTSLILLTWTEWVGKRVSSHHKCRKPRTPPASPQEPSSAAAERQLPGIGLVSGPTREHHTTHACTYIIDRAEPGPARAPLTRNPLFFTPFPLFQYLPAIVRTALPRLVSSSRRF